MNMKNTEEKESIPFFIIVIAVMIFLWVSTLYINPQFRSFPAVLFFSAGMGLHTILHWMFRKISGNIKKAVIYFCIQTLLASALIFYTGELSLVFGLYMALLGEEAGLFRSIKLIIVIVMINVLLILGTLFLRQSLDSIDIFFFIGIIPMILFVVIYVNLYSRQLEAKLEAQKLLKELERTNIKLSLSNARVEELTKEKERQRIARELHDTLAQGLSGLILQLEAVKALMDGGNHDKAGDIIEKSMMKARETLSDARGAIDDLRKKHLESVSLRDFIYSEVEAVKQHSSINYSVIMEGEDAPSVETGLLLMKIITEGLGNCAEHSEAENASVVFARSGDEFSLEITDDGRGFDPSAVGGGHYGLIGIDERVRIMGGAFSIESSPGNGTSLKIRVPGGSNAG